MTAPTTTKRPERDPRLDEPCQNPYELVNKTTGEVIEVPCGSRLDDVCPSCAVRYQIVQRRILDEGKPALPDAQALYNGTAQLPAAAWVTLTLPSFGPVTAGHAPKYPRTYRYADQVVAAVLEPEVLRAWTEAFRRATKDWRDAGFDVSVRGTREVQERGAGHYHLLVVVNPNTPRWDGVTRAPVGVEISERINAIRAGTASIPAELRTHIASSLVTDRRNQMELIKATPHTLRVSSCVRLGKQKDVQALNLFTSPAKDKDSFSRKASYASKALSYTVKDLGKAQGDAGRKNRSHLNRLKRESFAMVADYRATITVRRWLDKRIAERWNDYANSVHSLDKRRPGLLHELAGLRRARTQVDTVVRWNFLDEVTPKDVLSQSPLWRFFNGREQKVWVAAQVLDQLGLDSVFGVEDLRYLVKNLGIVLRRVIIFHGHTGSAVYSSQWPVTATMIRQAQKAWVIQQQIQSGVLTPASPPPGQWEPLHKPRLWLTSMAFLLPD